MLVCGETGEKVPIEKGLFAATQEGNVHFFPFSGDIIGKIPKEKRSATIFQAGEKGINIHDAASGVKGDFFLGKGILLGAFRFSIPSETAWAIIPRLTERLMKRRHR